MFYVRQNIFRKAKEESWRTWKLRETFRTTLFQYFIWFSPPICMYTFAWVCSTVRNYRKHILVLLQYYFLLYFLYRMEMMMIGNVECVCSFCLSGPHCIEFGSWWKCYLRMLPNPQTGIKGIGETWMIRNVLIYIYRYIICCFLVSIVLYINIYILQSKVKKPPLLSFLYVCERGQQLQSPGGQVVSVFFSYKCKVGHVKLVKNLNILHRFISK